MKCATALGGFTLSAGLLLPIWTAAESHLQNASPSDRQSAVTAHLDFRIIIPPVLALDVAGGGPQRQGAQSVAIYTNSRNVTLASSTGSLPAARNNVILSAAARNVIAQQATCAAPAVASVHPAGNAAPLICTVSMP